MPIIFAATMERNMEQAKKEIGEKAAAEFESEGRQMGFKQPVEYALDFDKD